MRQMQGADARILRKLQQKSRLRTLILGLGNTKTHVCSRADLKYSHHKRELVTMESDETVSKCLVVIILQDKSVSNQDVVHLEFI